MLGLTLPLTLLLIPRSLPEQKKPIELGAASSRNSVHVLKVLEWMSVSLSTHLLEQHYAFHQSRAPFGKPIRASELATCGPMSYAQQMHGFFPAQQSFMDQSIASTSMDGSTFQAMTDISESTAQRIATLQAKLNKKLGPEYISQRAGPGGAMKLTYAEGWKIINLANEVFGFNGWSSSIVNLNTDFVDYTEDTRRYNVGVSAVIRITLRDGVYHEDVGYGMLENSKSKGAALDKVRSQQLEPRFIITNTVA